MPGAVATAVPPLATGHGSTANPTNDSVVASGSSQNTLVVSSSLRLGGQIGSNAPQPPSAVADDATSSEDTESEDDPEYEPKIEYHFGGTPVQDCSALTGGRLSRDWARYVHFDGGMYFYDRRHRFLTTVDITNEKTYRQYEDALLRINDRISRIPLYSSHEQTLVILDIEEPESGSTFILDYRRGFFITPFSGDGHRSAHVETKTRSFWWALQAFPMHLQELPLGIESDFLGALTYGATERVLEWNDTTFPYTDEQSRKLMQVYRELKNDLDKGTHIIPAFCAHIASAMVGVEATRQAAKFGTAEAKLYRDVVTEKVGWKVKLADFCLGIVLFGVHRMYRMRMQGTRVKGVIYLEDFRELLRNLLAEWSDSNLLATVFVGANIAFLAVPNITGIQRTASLASTVFAVVSVATGVHHTWRHRAKLDARMQDASGYMGRYRPGKGREHDADLVVAACFLSIPVVSLLYAVLWFAVALGAFCMQSTDVHGRLLLIIVLAITCSAGLSTLLFFWHVWRGPPTAEVSEEDVTAALEYGWLLMGKRAVRRVKKLVCRRKGDA